MVGKKNVRRRRDVRIMWAGLFAFVAVFLFVFLVGASHEKEEEVSAASTAGFDPGYIISDWQMGNYKSMTEAEIQKFLTAKNPCDNKDKDLYKRLSAGSSYTWHFENGHFVCLSEEKFGDGEVIGKGETAAHIIYQAAQDYKINPQVLMVLLEKETSLITDRIPNSGDYRKATGYGCPDTAACSSKYYGFKNQVRNAAAMFRTVLDGGWTNYPLGKNYVQYNPNKDCGGSVVNIRNLATSALYRYTPYQPNAAALAAGYGTASCGAYGNRNFYLYFQDWFGGITSDMSLTAILKNMARVPDEASDVEMNAAAYVGKYDWTDEVKAGQMIGTAGYGLRLEGIKLTLVEGTSSSGSSGSSSGSASGSSSNADGEEKKKTIKVETKKSSSTAKALKGIEYRTHLANVGWESSYKKDGAVAGVPGAGNQIEAVQIRLTGDVAKEYDVYYRAHVQDIGWMEWVKNDEIAGTTGKAKRVEALQVKVVRKKYELSYITHVQDYGWMSWVAGGTAAGTTGRSKRVEALQLKLEGPNVDEGSLVYRTHVQDLGWMAWTSNGLTAGTTGQSKRVEAIEIKLTGEAAKKNDIYYRVHVQDIGWMDWVKNGELAGTTGRAKRVEAIEVKLVEK